MNTDKKTKELSVFIGVYLWQGFVFFTASDGRGSFWDRRFPLVCPA
jgi:hypothetical protein